MKVQELIKLLLRYDQEADVQITGTWWRNQTVPGDLLCLRGIGSPLLIRHPGRNRVEIYSTMERTTGIDTWEMPGVDGHDIF